MKEAQSKMKKLQSRKSRVTASNLEAYKKLELLREKSKKIKEEKKIIEDLIKRNEYDLKSIAKKMTNISKKDIVVSEHAIIRFLQRQMLYDIEKIKEKILPSEKMKAIKNFGNGKYPVENHKVVIKDNVVVTVE